MQKLFFAGLIGVLTSGSAFAESSDSKEPSAEVSQKLRENILYFKADTQGILRSKAKFYKVKCQAPSSVHVNNTLCALYPSAAYTIMQDFPSKPEEQKEKILKKAPVVDLKYECPRPAGDSGASGWLSTDHHFEKPVVSLIMAGKQSIFPKPAGLNNSACSIVVESDKEGDVRK